MCPLFLSSNIETERPRPGKQYSLPGARLATLELVERHCDQLAACAFFIWNQKGEGRPTRVLTETVCETV
jgi:hypothetical protein